MSRERFELVTVTNVITEESAAVGDYASTDQSEPTQVDLRGAVDALMSDHWDNIDARDVDVIAYPADYVQDYRTGAYAADTLIVRADSPANLERLMSCYAAARVAERARIDAYFARRAVR